MEEKKPEQAATSLEAPPDQAASTPPASGGADGAASDQPDSASGIVDATSGSAAAAPPPKKRSPLKAFLHKFNIYLLLFGLLVAIGASVSALMILNGKKAPPSPTVVNKNLTPEDLKQLANSNATVGDTGQTLTVQGNAIFTGQVLVRNDLSVAGNIKLGGSLSAQNFTASGTSNLSNTQAQTLQVAETTTLQGTVTVQHDLNVGGAASFSGPVNAGQITATDLILSGNATLQVPNHVSFDGPPPVRTSFSGGVLGAGGTASVDGSDSTGTINVSTGANPGTGCFISIRFHLPFAKTPHVLISPVGDGSGNTGYYVTRTTTGMSLCFSNAAPSHKVFGYDYFITD